MAFIHQKVLAETHDIKAACKNAFTTPTKQSECKAQSSRGSPDHEKPYPGGQLDQWTPINGLGEGVGN